MLRFITLLLFTFLSLYAKDPHKIQGRLNIVNGASAECVMHKFYTGTGWIQIKGEIGRNGIDGLYFKKKNGRIKEVLVAESKWNTSRLGLSGKGKTVKQMSKQWVMRTMDKLVRHLDNSTYRTLRALIAHDQYRARLFRLKPARGNAIRISVYKIKNKGDKAFDEIVESKLRPMSIDHPRNTFEQKMIQAYNSCRAHYLKKYMSDVLDDRMIGKLLHDNYIQKKDVRRITGL